MMKRLFFVPAVVLLMCGGLATASTNVGGVISADATWTLAGSPYIVVSDLMVANTATLSIDPGVEIRFQPDTILDISLGKLVARGTEANMIRFTANAAGPITEADRWGYIIFNDNSTDATFDGGGNYLDGSILEYVIVEYAGGIDSQAAIQNYFATPYITHSLIQENIHGGIAVLYADYLRLDSNTITKNGGESAVMFNISNNLALSHNTFTNNSALATLRLNSSHNTSLTGDRIINNAGSGIRVEQGQYLQVSTDTDDPVWVFGNDEYNIYNAMDFTGSFIVNGTGNVDARNVWWGTTDMAEIAEGIYDYMDNSSKGIVFFDPYFIPLPGDVNLDGWVSDTDLTIIIDNWGQSLGREFGDLDGNGVVDGPDYSEVISYWNPAPEPPGEPSPEPATLGLLLIGGLALLRRRRPG